MSNLTFDEMWRRSFITGGFSDLKTVIAEMTDSLDARREIATKRVLHSGDAEEISELEVNDRLISIELLFRELPTLQARLALVYADALVEEALRNLTRLARERWNPTVRPRDLGGTEMERARTYLTKVCGLHFENSSWGFLRGSRELRNAIVHRNSRLGESEKKRSQLRAFGRLSGGLLLTRDWDDPTSELRFETPLVSEMLERAEDLFGKLVEAIDRSA